MQHETLALAEGGKTSEVGFSLMKVALYSNGGSSATPLKSISNMNQKKRKLKFSQEKTEFRYSVNFTATEHAQFLTMFELSGLYSKSAFIRARVFNESFRVVKVDSTLLDYYQKLSELFGQFRSIGVNYNQVVKELKSNFTEKKALAMLFKLEKETKELGCIVKEIVFLTNEFREKWLQK